MITQTHKRKPWCIPLDVTQREITTAKIRLAKAQIKEIFEREKWDAIVTQWENEQADFESSNDFWTQSLA